jgi:hypothetical protein
LVVVPHGFASQDLRRGGVPGELDTPLMRTPTAWSCACPQLPCR